MRNKDVEELFEWIPIGTPVRIEGRRIKVQRVLRYRMTGSDVALLQMKLRETGFFSGRADGIFGSETQKAVQAYQQSCGLAETGIVDPKLLKKLGI